MDPRSKLILIFLFVCIVFLANNMLSYGLLTVYTFLMVALSKVPFRFIYTGLKPVLLLVIFTLFLHLFLTQA
ncbi:CbiQ family ECF transporter T component [Acinetobacter soli]